MLSLVLILPLAPELLSLSIIVGRVGVAAADVVLPGVLAID